MINSGYTVTAFNGETHHINVGQADAAIYNFLLLTGLSLFDVKSVIAGNQTSTGDKNDYNV